MKQCKGEIPEREKIFNLARKMGLSFKRIKKWLWDAKQKALSDSKLGG